MRKAGEKKQRNIRFGALFLVLASVFLNGCVEGEESANAGLSYAQWVTLASSLPTDTDRVFLKDGSIVEGEIDQLPPLVYSFGQVQLNPLEVALVFISKGSDCQKIQYVTRDGKSYLGSLKEKILTIRIKQGDRFVEKRLELSTINEIALFTIAPPSDLTNESLFVLEFKNGDQLPVNPALESISLKNGSIKTRSILEVHNDGGLYGVLKNNDEILYPLEFSPVQDLYFCIHAAQGRVLKLPWEKIAVIQGENRGFMQEIVALEKKFQPIPRQSEKEEEIAFADNNEMKTQLLGLTENIQLESIVEQLFAVSDFESPFLITYDFDDSRKLPTLEEMSATLTAFAAEGYDAFLEPLPVPFDDEKQDETVQQKDNHHSEKNDAAEPLLFVQSEFDSPIRIVYEIDGVEQPDMFNVHDAFEKLEIAFVQGRHDEEIAMVDSDLVKINQQLLSENQKSVKIDPPSFDYDPSLLENGLSGFSKNLIK